MNKADLDSEHYEINYNLLRERFKEDIIKISSKESINLQELAYKCRNIAEKIGIRNRF